jgi:antitoxin component YwqK of YwqJK toxin-antitoxin module
LNNILGPIDAVFYYQNGKINGECIMYHYDGSILSNRQYVDNKIVDTYCSYYGGSGGIRVIYNFVDNKRTTMTEYKNKKIYRTGVLLKNNGIWSEYEITQYDDNGEFIRRTTAHEYDYPRESISVGPVLKMY